MRDFFAINFSREETAVLSAEREFNGEVCRAAGPTGERLNASLDHVMRTPRERCQRSIVPATGRRTIGNHKSSRGFPARDPAGVAILRREENRGRRVDKHAQQLVSRVPVPDAATRPLISIHTRRASPWRSDASEIPRIACRAGAMSGRGAAANDPRPVPYRGRSTPVGHSIVTPPRHARTSAFARPSQNARNRVVKPFTLSQCPCRAPSSDSRALKVV